MDEGENKQEGLGQGGGFVPEGDKHVELQAEELRRKAQENAEKVSALEAAQAEARANKPAVDEHVAEALHNDSPIKPLRTFQGDVADAIERQKASLIHIKMAEEKRRAQENAPDVKSARWSVRAVSIVLSILLILVGISLFVVSRFLAQPAPAPIVVYDTIIPYDTSETESVIGSNRNDLISLFGKERSQNVATDSVTYLKLSNSTSTQPKNISTGDFLDLLQTKIPPELERSFNPEFMAGIYSGDSATPFIFIKVDSFDNAYSGMLSWEQTLPSDLGPLFTGETVKDISMPETSETSEASSETASSSTSTSTASSTTPPPVQTIPDVSPNAPFKSAFSDLVVNNMNTRVVRDTAGQIILIYSFIDNNTLLITGNEDAFKGLVSKYQDSKLLR